MILASAFDNDAVVKLLLDRGADVHDAVPKPISTALHLAANFGRYNNARLLLEHRADTHAAESWTKRVPLFYACWMRRPNVVRLLLSWGANPNQLDFVNRNCLHFACFDDEPEDHTVVRILLGKDPSVQFAEIDRNQQTTDGWTPLMAAIHAEHFSCAREMLSDSKVDLTLRDNEGDTALSCAARHGALFLMFDILRTDTYFPADPLETETCIATEPEKDRKSVV